MLSIWRFPFNHKLNHISKTFENNAQKALDMASGIKRNISEVAHLGIRQEGLDKLEAEANKAIEMIREVDALRNYGQKIINIDFKRVDYMNNNQAYIFGESCTEARDLKEFLVLRDTHPSFDKVRERGNIGIPCFVKEDGSVIISLKHYDSSLAEADIVEDAACNLDGSDC